MEGVLTDVTTAKLSDPTGTYGVKRNDTDGVVVADGTSMTHVSTGIYQYTFDEPVEGLVYTGYVEFLYAGQTSWFEHDIPAGAAASSLLTTYSELRSAVGYYLFGRSDSTDWTATEGSLIDRILRSALKRFYFPPGHTWTFLQPESTITTVEPYDTGTIAVVDGVVTLSDGTWPSWAAGGMLAIDGAYYAVVSRDSDSQLTVDDSTLDVDSGTRYQLARYAYDLPANFLGFEGSLRPRNTAYALYDPIEHRAADEVRRRLSVDPQFFYPRIVGMRAKTFDATVGQLYQAVFYPIPDAAYTFFYTYRVTPGMLSADNPYPLGGAEHSETIREACLAVAEREHDGIPGLHNAEFERLLGASIAIDKDHHSPATVGVDYGQESQDLSSWETRHVNSRINWQGGGSISGWI